MTEHRSLSPTPPLCPARSLSMSKGNQSLSPARSPSPAPAPSPALSLSPARSRRPARSLCFDRLSNRAKGGG